MPLTGTGSILGMAISTKIKTQFPNMTSDDMDNLWSLIATEIVNHITNNGMVMIDSPAPVNGVAAVTVPGAPAPVVGTAGPIPPGKIL